MWKRFAISWEMTKASWTVLMENKKLFIFPIISMLAIILICLSFFIPLFSSNLLKNLDSVDTAVYVAVICMLFVFYLISYVIVFYCNSALVGIVLMRIRGETATLKDGFRIANKHLKVIIGYSFIASTVGVILQWLSERGTIGNFVAGLFGVAWSLATYLVVPVLVSEQVGPIDALKRSATLLKATWGETIIGNAGIGLVFGVLMIIPAMIGGTLIGALSAKAPELTILIAVLLSLFCIAMGLISSTLTSVYRAAIYHYVTAGTAGPYFKDSQLKEAFKLK